MKKLALIMATLLALTGCASLKDRVLDTGDQSQVEKRSYQSRVFDTNDKQKVLRAVIATLQDLGFVIDKADAKGVISDAVVAHLDKSHITVHTYPESNPVTGISTFRADIDVSTCGRISPLRALNYLIHSF